MNGPHPVLFRQQSVLDQQSNSQCRTCSAKRDLSSLPALQANLHGMVRCPIAGASLKSWSGSATMWRRTSMTLVPLTSPAATWMVTPFANTHGTSWDSSLGPWVMNCMIVCMKSVSMADPSWGRNWRVGGNWVDPNLRSRTIWRC